MLVARCARLNKSDDMKNFIDDPPVSDTFDPVHLPLPPLFFHPTGPSFADRLIITEDDSLEL